MTTKNDGGPAFPVKRMELVGITDGESVALPVDHPGMSLRDWFAGQALAGLCASWTPEDSATAFSHGLHAVADAMSRQAFACADAMLAARGGGE